MVRFTGIATALTFALLALPGLASGQGAAGDQYTEQIPNAAGGGNGDIDGSASGGSTDSGGGSGSGATATGGGGNGGPLGSATVDKFAQGGSDGKEAAGLAGSTAPDSAALNDAAAAAQAGTSEGSTSVFDARGDTSSSDDGIGVALPIILAIVLLGGIAYAWRRRRGDSDGTGGQSTSSLRDRFRSSLPGRS